MKFVCVANVCVSVLLCVQFKSCHSDEVSNLLHEYCGAAKTDNYIYLNDALRLTARVFNYMNLKIVKFIQVHQFNQICSIASNIF